MRARNLRKNQLGGVIFGCTNATMRDCLANQLFGLPRQHFSYVKQIEDGLPLFLFNYSQRKLYGIYEAVGSGQMNIDQYAWTEDGSERTMFPAQVRIRVRLQSQSLPEVQFKPIIMSNYYNQVRFRFELDHAQASKLISKFSSLVVAPDPFMRNESLKLANAVPQLPNEKPEINGTLKLQPSAEDFSNYHDHTGSSDDSLRFDGNNHLANSSSSNQVIHLEENDIYMDFQELTASRDFSEPNRIGHAIGPLSTSGDALENETHDDDTLASSRSAGSSLVSLDYPYLTEQLLQEIEELNAFKQEHTQIRGNLEKKLADAEKIIHRLESGGVMLESVSDTLESLDGEEMQIEPPGKIPLKHDESIIIVGGHDGESWLSTLDSFSPSNAVLRSLKSMSTVRSYASVARLNGELYVFGGGDGYKWYDTVESYNAANDEWVLRPSLNKCKGCLGGASLHGKIFAIGGGNGVECLSEVEMFDPYVGRWIYARPMLEKRYSVSAVELNGALYAIGGRDGEKFLKTAERFDPREHHTWTTIGSMHESRGSLASVAMNEKLYSIGGYDGVNAVCSVEVYDPRLDTWMIGEAMNHARCSLSAAVLKGSIYAIGGLNANHILDKIECFKEGGSWEEMNLSAVGRRCFASVIASDGD